MAGELIGEALGSVLRFLGRLLMEVVVEFLIRGTGYLLCRLFRRSPDLEDPVVLFIGMAFWVLVATSAYLFFYA